MVDYSTLPDVKDMTDAELLAELPTTGKLTAASVVPGDDFPQQPSMAEHDRRRALEAEARIRGLRF